VWSVTPPAPVNRPAPFPGRMSYKATKKKNIYFANSKNNNNTNIMCKHRGGFPEGQSPIVLDTLTPRLNQVYFLFLFLFYVLACVILYCFRCYVFCFLVDLVCHYLPSDWLERLLWGSLIMVRGSSPESRGQRVCVISWFIVLSLFHYLFVLSPDPTWYNYFPTFMARYSLFVQKVHLNPKQTNLTLP